MKKDNKVKTVLRSYRTDIKKKQFTYCPNRKGVIMGSDTCRGCYLFRDIDFESTIVRLDGKITNHIIKGVIECVDKKYKG